MRIFDKGLLIEEEKIYYEDNNVINKIKLEKKLISQYQVKLNASELGEDIIDKLINNKDLYDCIKEYFNSDSCPMNISIVKNNKIYNYYLYKINLLQTLDECLKENKIKIENKTLNNIKELSNSINLTKLKERLNNKTFTIKINNKYINYPYNSIFDFLEADDKTFYSFFENNESYNGINKSMFLYIIKEFYKQYNQAYLFSSNIKQKINYIEKQNDIEYIEYEKKYKSELPNSIYKNIKLNNEFKEDILNSIPNNLNNLEKVLFIYIRLCQILKFDLASYASAKEESIISKHKDLNRLKEVNTKEKNIVCWEINAIFASLLNELNIDFEIKKEVEDYGEGHAWLRVKLDDMLLSFDPIHRMFYEYDLLQAKVNLPLKGIKLYNKNNKVIEKYNNSLNKIYSLLYKKNINNNYDYIINDNNISIFEKISLMANFTEEKNLEEIESIAYLLNMYKKLKEKDNNIIIEDRVIETHLNNEYKLHILFIIKSRNKEKEDYTYYVYTPKESLKKYNSEDLKSLFEQNIFNAQNKEKDMFIPGINYLYKKQIDISQGRIK